MLALTAALAATACMGALAPEGGTAAAGKVRVRLFAGSAGAESRSVIPKADFDSYALSFDSDDGYSHDPVVFDGAGPIAVDLEPGTWTISVIASKEGVPSGKGSLSAVIDASTTTLTIPIDRMVTGGDVNGTFAYTIGYPSGGYTAKTLIITNTDGTGLGNGTFTLKDSGVQDSIELPPGVYTAAFILADTDKRLSASRMEVVHIYAKQTSGFAFTFRDTDFYAQAIITGTASFSVPTLKDGQRVAREEILAFGDAACTQALGKESLDAGGGYTLFIPTSYAAVWLRPELTTGADKKLYGKAEKAEIPPDPAASVTQNLISVFYAISASAVNGTITVAGIPGDTLAALPGDAVDFTVSPEAGYHLIDGTVQVNGSSGGISGAGPYRFTMPGGGAALGAEFAKDTYTVGMDTMSNGSVTVDPPAGTAVPWGETVTLTVSPGEDYELTAGSLKANDGEVALSPGGGSSYSFVMPKADVRVSAEFEKLKYPLTLGALSNGVVASTSGHSFGASAAWGETISF
ncbi:MAG: PASTA domain-containing protein, partial [Treponema sp.]|nr:PASTA domain-containing protein [Treponema sp.]